MSHAYAAWFSDSPMGHTDTNGCSRASVVLFIESTSQGGTLFLVPARSQAEKHEGHLQSVQELVLHCK